MTGCDPVIPRADDLRRLDAQYTPIKSFSSWLLTVPDIGPAWAVFVDRFSESRQLIPQSAADDVIRGAMRAAAVNTGAIEGLHQASRGLTITVMQEAASWQTAVSEAAGVEAAALSEAALEGYQMALDFATGREEFSEAWIRRVHEVVCEPQPSYRVMTSQGFQDHELPLGTYKTEPNHVRAGTGLFHAYAPVDIVGDEMHRLMEEIRSEAFRAAHPALQTAYVHHAFTAIHPFADGNGRVARVLASVFTLRAASVPLVVFDDQKPLYFASLESADEGNNAQFVYFIVDRVVDILGILIENMRGANSNTGRYVDRLTTLLTGQGGLAHKDIDAIAVRTLGTIGELMTAALSRYSLPEGVRGQPFSMSLQTGRDPGPLYLEWRFPTAQQSAAVFAGITVSSDEPIFAQVSVRVDVLVNKDRSDRYAFEIRAEFQTFAAGRQVSDSPVEEFSFRLDEVYPEQTSAFRIRADAWARRLTADTVRRLTEAAEQTLRTLGMLPE